MPEPRKAGRPRKEIDWQQFEKVLQFLPTLSEVASFFGVSERTFQRAVHRQYKENYDALLKRFGDKTKLSLRRNMIVMSEKNATMAIFLAKNLLGFKDQPEPAPMDIDGLILIDPDDPRVKEYDGQKTGD